MGIKGALFFWIGLLDRGLWLVFGALLAVSLLYFLASRNRPLVSQVLDSVHGVLFVVAFAYALLVAGVLYQADMSGMRIPFLALIVLGALSIIYSIWDLRRKWFLHLAHIFTLSYGLIVLYRGELAFDPSYTTATCWLPDVALSVPSQTIASVGDTNDRTRNSCPVPVPRKLAVQRPYGNLELELWGSPHKLFAVATTNNGAKLRIVGELVRPYHDLSGSWLNQYRYFVLLPGDDFVFSPRTTEFSMSVLDQNDRVLDTIRVDYRTQQCSCAIPKP